MITKNPVYDRTHHNTGEKGYRKRATQTNTLLLYHNNNRHARGNF